MKHQQTVQSMAKFPVAEIFESINGEGKKAGELALFIRFAGCNLKCSYCDTSWAINDNNYKKEYGVEELVEVINKSKITNVTITGGEPLLQNSLNNLLKSIPLNIQVEIETNGSLPINRLKETRANLSFTMDYKLPDSGMENKMNKSNFLTLDSRDSVKFVVSSIEDLNRSKEIIEKYNLLDRVTVYFSSVFNQLEPNEVVEYMKSNRLNGIKLQLQMHKYIWDPQLQGV